MKRYIISVIAVLGLFGLEASARNAVADSLEFDKALATSPAGLLRGNVAGLRVSATDGNVNGALNTYIRGVNALRGDSQPLWIVDGLMVNAGLTDNNDAFFQYGEESYTSPINALAYLNPYDIESIEVIKDLSAAALYGARGANGVIIVKTKLARSGGFNISWNSNFGVSSGITETRGLSHNHSISLNGTNGQAQYNISAYYRRLVGAVAGDSQNFGGVRAHFDTHANAVVWFGMDATFTLGKMSSASGTSFFGQPSTTLTMRNENFFPNNTAEGWKSDYDDDATDRRGTTSMYVTLNFTPALSLKTTIGLDVENNNRYIWYGNGTSFGKSSNGAASLLSTSIFRYSGESILKYSRFFSSRHKFSAKAGIQATGDLTKYNTENGTDFFSHVLRAKGINISASAPDINKYDHNYATFGFFAVASYEFDSKAGAEIIVRADKTPRYDADFQVFKGGNLFYNILPNLKVKAGYGEAGREKYVPYGMYGNYVAGNYPSVDRKYEGYYEGFNRIRSREFNAGIDVSLFEKRLGISAGFYSKNTDDTFYSYCFGGLKEGDTFLWSSKPRTDDFTVSSSIANRGFEGSIDFKIFNSKDLEWSISLNGAYNVNQMIAVDSKDTFGKSVGSNTRVNANAVGRAVGSLYGYRTDDAGNILDINGNGRTDEFDQAVIGNPIPKFNGGLNSSFRYGNITAEISTDAAFGFEILNLGGLLFDGASVISDKYVEKGDYFRINRVSLGYDIPLKKNKVIKGLKVSASALNPLTFSKYSGWNPDVNSFGASGLTSGVDYGSYPILKSAVLGVSLKF